MVRLTFIHDFIFSLWLFSIVFYFIMIVLVVVHQVTIETFLGGGGGGVWGMLTCFPIWLFSHANVFSPLTFQICNCLSICSSIKFHVTVFFHMSVSLPICKHVFPAMQHVFPAIQLSYLCDRFPKYYFVNQFFPSVTVFSSYCLPDDTAEFPQQDLLFIVQFSQVYCLHLE